MNKRVAISAQECDRPATCSFNHFVVAMDLADWTFRLRSNTQKWEIDQDVFQKTWSTKWKASSGEIWKLEALKLNGSRVTECWAKETTSDEMLEGPSFGTDYLAKTKEKDLKRPATSSSETKAKTKKNPGLTLKRPAASLSSSEPVKKNQKKG